MHNNMNMHLILVISMIWFMDINMPVEYHKSC